MLSDGAVFARVPGGDCEALHEIVARVRAATRRDGPIGVLAFDPDKHGLALVDRWGRRDSMPGWAEGPDLGEARELAALSAAAGEVVAFYTLDEGAGLGVYGHWIGGELVRGLVSMDEVWAEVTGEPQPWEAPLFSDEHLARALEDTALDGGDEQATREAYAAGRVRAGERHPRPFVAGLTLHGAMARVLRLPPWAFQPWPPRRDVPRKGGR